MGAGVIAVFALRLKALSRSGAIAALFAGTIAAAAGWAFAVCLIAFFSTSTALSKFRKRTKEKIFAGIVAKGDTRDWTQVVANGGVFTAAALWFIISRNSVVMLAAFGALSAANADTWSTEVGSLSWHEPRSILNGKRVSPGTSGGVTLLGLFAGFAGAAFIGIVCVLAGLPVRVLAACSVAGLAGCVADSLLGATVQAQRRCARCRQATERKTHNCGELTEFVSGVRWIDNDVVNVLCTLAGAGIAALWVL